MITLAQSFDVPLIDSIIRDESVFPFVNEDTITDPKDFTSEPLVFDANNYFFRVDLDGVCVGCFGFLGIEMHTCLLKTCRGKNAVDAGRKVLGYFLSLSGAKEILSFAFKELPHTLWYAKQLGFSRYGKEISNSIKRNGVGLTRINLRYNPSPCQL